MASWLDRGHSYLLNQYPVVLPLRPLAPFQNRLLEVQERCSFSRTRSGRRTQIDRPETLALAQNDFTSFLDVHDMDLTLFDEHSLTRFFSYPSPRTPDFVER
jgi:hypothetical protein